MSMVDELIFILLLLSVTGGVSSVLAFPLLETLAAAGAILISAWLFTQERTPGRILLLGILLTLSLRIILSVSAWFWLGVALLAYILLLFPRGRGRTVRGIAVPQQMQRRLQNRRMRQQVSQKRRVPRRDISRRVKSSQRGHDDLTRIKGIGTKLAAALRKAGIYTFTDLANASEEQLKQIARKAGLRALRIEDWQRQARLAAEGRWTTPQTPRKRSRRKRSKKSR